VALLAEVRVRDWLLLPGFRAALSSLLLPAPGALMLGELGAELGPGLALALVPGALGQEAPSPLLPPPLLKPLARRGRPPGRGPRGAHGMRAA